MKTHLKREMMPKNWPIPRKGTTWVVRPSSNLESGIPILIALRDILKLGKNRKEVKKMLQEKNILVNGKIAREEKNSLTLFDVLEIVSSKKNYRISLTEKGKFKLNEISESDAEHKVSKIVNKKMLKGKKIQLNMLDGRNILTDVKCKTNDSVLINFKNKKIEKCLELKEKAKVLVFGGKHAGAKGKIENIDDKHKIVELSDGEKKIKALIKHLIVTE